MTPSDLAPSDTSLWVGLLSSLQKMPPEGKGPKENVQMQCHGQAGSRTPRRTEGVGGIYGALAGDRLRPRGSVSTSLTSQTGAPTMPFSDETPDSKGTAQAS